MEKIKQFIIGPKNILTSLDLYNMYANIPHLEALQLLEKKLLVANKFYKNNQRLYLEWNY